MSAIRVSEQPSVDSARLRLLVADRAATRVGVRLALGSAVEVCAEAGDAEAAAQAAKRHQPDVCLVALDLVGGGVEAVRAITRAAPGTSVVVLATQPDFDDLLAAVRAGAVGYLPAGVAPESLRRAVQAVAANEAVIPRTLVLDLMQELRAADAAGADGLTAREAQVLSMLRRGHSTSAIARRLEIAPVTVRRHVSQLRAKLGAKTRSDLLAD
jgi:DNA-binding NarL/FixJ family response regulator